MEQKVIQVGNSLAITIPSHFVKSKGIKAGQKIFVDANPELDVMQVTTKSTVTFGITPEFKKWLDKFTENHEDVLKELAKR